MKQGNIENAKEKLKEIFAGVNDIAYRVENSEIQIILIHVKNFEREKTDNYGQKNWRILSAEDDTVAIKYHSIWHFIEMTQNSTSASLSKSL